MTASSTKMPTLFIPHGGGPVLTTDQVYALAQLSKGVGADAETSEMWLWLGPVIPTEHADSVDSIKSLPW